MIKTFKYKKINGMKGKIKKFDQKLSDVFDTKSREIIKKLLGESVDDNPNKYGEDMIVVNKMIPYDYIELQVYGKWTDQYFPYSMPFVYERKLKFCDRTLFICFNSQYDKLVMFCRSAIRPKRYRLKKYSREMICYVPWGRALCIDTKSFTIESILNYSGIFLDNESEEMVEDNLTKDNLIKDNLIKDNDNNNMDDNMDDKMDDKMDDNR